MAQAPSSPGGSAASLNDPDDDVREEVVFAIGEIGTDDKPILDALEHAAEDPSPAVSSAAIEAIEKLEEDDDEDNGDAGKPATKKAPPKKS